jgi:eukaryotic-like serine/threonine-protein kinase
VALDAATGNVVWSRWFPQPIWTSVTVANGPVYATGNSGAVRAFDASTGSLVWKRATREECESPPSVAGSTMVISVGGSSLIALNAVTGATKWTVSIDPTTVCAFDGFSPALFDGIAYAGSVGSVTAVDVSSGAIQWQQPAVRNVFFPVSTDGTTVLVPTDNGQLVALDPATGAILWTRSWTAVSRDVSVANGVVYVGTN